MIKRFTCFGVVVVMLTWASVDGLSKEQPPRSGSDVIKTLYLSPTTIEKESLEKYQKMVKEKLRITLKNLQKTVIQSERKAKAADDAVRKARKAYNASADERKPDALLRMIEVEASAHEPRTVYEKDQLKFKAAQKAYLNLLTKTFRLDSNTSKKEPIRKYQKMVKEKLRITLKNLQKTVIQSERKAKAADNAVRKAQKAYNASANERKPDALLRMIEAEATACGPRAAYAKDNIEFKAAQKAYLNLLILKITKAGFGPRERK